MKYCPDCRASRSGDQVDENGYCVVCGHEVVEDRNDAAPKIDGESSAAAEPVADAAPALPSPVESSDEAGDEPDPLEEWRGARGHRKAEPKPERTPEGQGAVETGHRVTDRPRRSSVKTDSASSGATTVQVASEDLYGTRRQPSAARGETVNLDYAKWVDEVEANRRDGYRFFGLVGGPQSGKSHALKALNYLLNQGGTRSEKASLEFRKASVPGPTGYKVGHYDFVGPGKKWTFVDPGGELYTQLQRADPKELHEGNVLLSRWLFHCDGLLCFLHLRQGHFGGPVLDADPTLEEDDEERQRVAAEREKAKDDQAELDAFPNYLLFLRALKAENGDVGKVLEAIGSAGSVEGALHSYDQTAPLLDVPVLFFFSKADIYSREGQDFVVGKNNYVNPRTAELHPAVFTARYLPTLFTGVASQVRRFKFDFLQSYEEAVTGRYRPMQGRTEEIVKTYWSYPGEKRSLLSVGLMSGVEFLLRNQPRQRRFWEPPELDTRRALKLHRLLHPNDWQGVPPDILGSWLSPRDSEKKEGTGAKSATPQPDGEEA